MLEIDGPRLPKLACNLHFLVLTTIVIIPSTRSKRNIGSSTWPYMAIMGLKLVKSSLTLT